MVGVLKNRDLSAWGAARVVADKELDLVNGGAPDHTFAWDASALTGSLHDRADRAFAALETRGAGARFSGSVLTDARSGNSYLQLSTTSTSLTVTQLIEVVADVEVSDDSRTGGCGRVSLGACGITVYGSGICVTQSNDGLRISLWDVATLGGSRVSA